MSEDNFSIKEMVLELRSETRQQTSSLSRIESHLATLTSKVDRHELLHKDHLKEIKGLSTFKTQAMLVWGVIVLVITTVINKVI